MFLKILPIYKGDNPLYYSKINKEGVEFDLEGFF